MSGPESFRRNPAGSGTDPAGQFHKFTIGHAWVSDFGNPEESDEMFDYISSYSPLQ